MQIFKNWSYCFFLLRGTLPFPHLLHQLWVLCWTYCHMFCSLWFCCSLPKGGGYIFFKWAINLLELNQKICLLSKRSKESLVLLYWVRVYLVYSWFRSARYSEQGWNTNYGPCSFSLPSWFLPQYPEGIVQNSVLCLFR